MCGFSGLPKFRQLVRPSGSAPAQARLAEHSSTASTAPRYGSTATRRPLPSIETAMAGAAVEHQHRGVGRLGAAHGARADDAVVLLERPPARREVGAAQQRQQRARRRTSPSASMRGGARVDRVRRARPARGRRPGTRRPARTTGRSPTSSPPSNTRSRSESVTSPMAVALTSHLSHTASTSATRSGSTTQSIRSCDSEIMISKGSMSASRSGTCRTSRSIPTSPLAAISADEEVSPAAPRSCSATSSPCVEQLQRALEQLLLLERVADLHRRALVGVRVAELGAGQHRRAADPVAPRARAEQHDARCRRRRRRDLISLSVSISPTHIALTRQFCSYGPSKYSSPPTVATPIELP